MNVLVTGAAGSGGSYMLEYLVKKEPGNKYLALVRNKDSITSGHLSNAAHDTKITEIAYCDLQNYESTLQVVSQFSPDQVYHFASNANVKESFHHPVSVLQNNIMGTAHLLEACRAQVKKPRILMCSTSEVYGQVTQDEVPIKETNSLRPASPYAVSKTTQDLLSAVYGQAFQVPVIRSRMFTYINPRRENLFATSFAMQVARIERGQQAVLTHGNLESVRTHMDIRDVVAAYFEVMNKGLPGEVYNLGGTTPFSVKEFLEILKSKARCEVKTALDPSLLRPVDVTLQIPDVSKFEKITDWRPQYSLNDSIDHLLSECRKKLEN